MSTSPSHDIITLLVRNEELLAQLYEVYAEHFPEHHDFWMQLCQEELSHIRILRSLEQEMAEGALRITHERAALAMVQRAVQYTASSVKLASASDMPLDAAVSMARDLEETLLEDRLVEIFEAVTPEVRAVLDRFAESFTAHSRRLQAFRKK